MKRRVLRIGGLITPMSSRIKIYTRTGDKGQTSLYGGKRVGKDSIQVVAYGTVDELNSAIGVLIAHLINQDNISSFLIKIQGDLFTIGAHLSGSRQNLDNIAKRVPEMEHFIDDLDKDLPPLKNFILPGGNKEASLAHLARSICRRAERKVVRLLKEQGFVNKGVIIYLNRLSDLLFIIARYLNKTANAKDVIWTGN